MRGGVPAVRGEFIAGLGPGLAVERGAGRRALEVAHGVEAVANGRVNEVERSVAAEREPAAIREEGSTGAESIGL